MPVRKIRPSKTYAFRGKEPSDKGTEVVHWESLLELDMVKVLEFDTRVMYFEHQPFRLNYEYQYKSYNYTPDFKVEKQDGNIVVIEVKPLRFLDEPTVQTKLEVGHRFCHQQGWEYRVVTEEKLRVGFLQDNLDLLLDVRGYSTEKVIEHRIINAVKKLGPCSIKELFKNVKDISEESFYLHLYLLLYRQVLYTDLINIHLQSTDFIVRLPRLEDCKDYGWL